MDAQGRENMKCVLEKIGKEESAEKRVKKKRMRAHPFCCILGSLSNSVDEEF